MFFNPQSAIRNPQFLILFLLLSSTLWAQTAGTTYTIYGRVALPDGNPASRVSISISSQSGLNWQATADVNGQYEIMGLPRGRYSLSATNPAAPEQYSDRAEVDIARFSPPRVSVNLYLRAGTKVETSKEGQSSGVTVAEAGQHVPKAAQKEYDKAIKEAKQKQLQKALESFNRSIELFPEYFQAITERGHLRVTLGQIEEAGWDFSRALELNPRYEPAMRGAGICRLREGKYPDAIKELERAVSAEPRDAVAYLFLGFAYASIDRRELARGALQKALTIDAVGSARAHVHLANLDLKENRNREAAAELEAYLAAVPNAPDADKLRQLLSQLRATPANP
jgi:tetratricopeptide (TPR) repeat protein